LKAETTLLKQQLNELNELKAVVQNLQRFASVSVQQD